MSISLKRARAIFVKDYKEFSRNYAISIIVLFPIIFAFLLRGVGPSLPGAFGFVLNTSFVILTSLAQACLIAEEKERNTLRSLMMTPATTMDVLIGKSTLVFVMSAVVLAIATYIFGYEPASIWVFVAVIILSIILYTAAGTICGLFSKTLLETSLSIIPVAIVFTGAPWGALLVKDFPIFKVLEYVPSSQLVYLLKIHNIGFTTGDLLKPLLITLIWTVVLTIVSVVLYQRRLKDE
ncbi:ABC-2 type transport system permease protein [Paenibacillus tianmuensis]|uniref:ABC-2 type transport system permease protein n=1 Tax=Paenibacillus tianmuensis TaxID=624147 RepID=A0A1G4SA94_9BACL|nr:ABC transporter permease [Paenibacillus tianmuensis]SCW66030.1 ABC-2 type transport system permease protein [Paenibacillus tianmuensis]